MSEETRRYRVVRNDEEQYSILPEGRENPDGWEDAGPPAPKDDCLRLIGEIWTDMRPLSLRRRMESSGE